MINYLLQNHYISQPKYHCHICVFPKDFFPIDFFSLINLQANENSILKYIPQLWCETLWFCRAEITNQSRGNHTCEGFRTPGVNLSVTIFGAAENPDAITPVASFTPMV